MIPWRGDRGSAPVEVAILAPAIFGLLMVVIFAGRVAQADTEVQSAASAAARAASQQANAALAEAKADEIAFDNLADAGIVCEPGDVSPIDPSTFHPGGSVQVTVTCITPLDDLMFFELPGSRTLEATSTEVIDTFRGGS